MYTEAELYRSGRCCTVRAAVTRDKDGHHKFLTPIEVWNGVGWVKFTTTDEAAIEDAEAVLTEMYDPEAEAAGDWRIP